MSVGVTVAKRKATLKWNSVMQAEIFRKDLMPNDSQKSRRGFPTEALSITEVIPYLLRTIVRLLVGTISYPVLIEILKAIYVEEGEKKLIRTGSKPTKSALALITGMDTRVVSSVLANNCDTTINPQQISPEYTLIDTWCSDPFFMDHSAEGPAILPVEGRGKTFQSLVLKVIGRNITVKTVMDRLLKSNTIEILNGDTQEVKLLSKTYTPVTSDIAKLTDITFLEASRVMGAGIHNMNAVPEERVPQQGRWTYRLAPERYREFRREARLLIRNQIKEGEDLLERFEEEKKQPGQLTVGIGWYQWGDHETQETGE